MTTYSYFGPPPDYLEDPEDIYGNILAAQAFYNLQRFKRLLEISRNGEIEEYQKRVKAGI